MSPFQTGFLERIYKGLETSGKLAQVWPHTEFVIFDLVLRLHKSFENSMQIDSSVPYQQTGMQEITTNAMFRPEITVKPSNPQTE